MARTKKMLDHENTLEGMVADALSEAQSLRDEIADWRDNMESNNMEHLPKYEQVSECVDNLEQFCDNEPQVPSVFPPGLADKIKWQTIAKRRMSRADRLGDAHFTLQLVSEHVQEYMDAHEAVDDPVWEAAPREGWEQFVSDIDEIMNDMDSVEFPGMFG